jgi:hypothetical protein
VRSLALSLPLVTIVIGCGFSAPLKAESPRYCAAYFYDRTHITLFPMVGPEVYTDTGRVLGALFTALLGGEGAFGGAPVGCFTGAVSAMVDGLPHRHRECS